MNGKRRKRRRHLLTWAGEESINLTPLLDVIFNLIFFFLLATTLRKTQAFLQVDLPAASEAQKSSLSEQNLIITVTEDDKIYINDQETNPDLILDQLKEFAPEEISRIIIKGDEKADHGIIVVILNACAGAGHTGVSVQAVKDASEN